MRQDRKQKTEKQKQGTGQEITILSLLSRVGKRSVGNRWDRIIASMNNVNDTVSIECRQQAKKKNNKSKNKTTR